ncbi:MAG: YncE family protein [Thermodesulfobacteriota bacterium]
MKKSLPLICLFFLMLGGCQATLTKILPPLEEEGEVYLYLEPFPQVAERLRFDMSEIFAVNGDGREIALTLSLQVLQGPEMRRQRLLASGPLPPGPYVGFSFKVKEAIVKSEEGEAALLVPETPSSIDLPFRIDRRAGRVISLELKYPDSIRDTIHFTPAFSAFIPNKPVNSRIGYVTNSGSNDMIVFDKKSAQVFAVIPTGSGPSGMALDQNLLRAYVALPSDDAIEMIDVTAGAIVNRMRLSTGDRPKELALTSDGKNLLCVNNGSNSLSFIDPGSLFELGRINVGNGPHSVLIDQTERRAFVFNRISSTISVIDIPNRALITTIGTEPGPLRGQFNRGGDRLFVIHELSSYLTVIDPRTLSTVRRFSVRIGMNSIKVDTRTDLVYIGRKIDPMVEVYDPVSFVSVDYVRAGSGVTYMTIDGEENNLYMVNSQKNRVTISNVVSKKIVGEIDVGEGPYWVTMMGER